MPIRDTRLIARALVQRWDIRPEYRDALIRRLVRIIADPASSPREVTAASKAIISAEAQNQKDEHQKIDEFRNKVLTIAERCGIDIHLLGLSNEATGSSEAGNTIDLESS